jgi:hypothetical protein
MAGQEALQKDVFLNTAFNKLVAAGLIKLA